jgi:hypothetical protein
LGIIALAIWLVVTRGLQLKQLLEDGVEAKGTVLRQFKSVPRGPQSTTNYFLRYRYRDAQGGEHEYKFKAGYDLWQAHPEGAPIDIFYSKSKPSVSAPRALVEQARAAMK